MHLPNGHQLQNGKYKLTCVIGQGGFGITYKGIWHTEVQGSLGKVKTDVSVCIKEYFFKDYCYRDHASSEVKVHSETGKILFNKFKEKLIKEARILSDVHYPYIVNVLEVFEENNTAYIAMEYIDGYSLKQRMEREGVLSENIMLKYIHQIGEALQFVHEKNILHLDIKPSNILIDKNDNARLIDFGVSKRYDIEEQETSTTMLTLSKGFASIEQYDDEGTIAFSPKPDIYSLGATMYNLITGKIPVESILRATKELQKPSAINPSISEKTEQVILQAMAVNPAARYNSVSEMLEGLDKPVIAPVKSEVKTTTPTHNPVDDETTVLNPPLLGEEDDQTILNSPLNIPPKKKKSRKKFFIPLIVSLFVVVSFAAIMTYNNKADVKSTVEQSENVQTPVAEVIDTEPLPAEKEPDPGNTDVQEQPSQVSNNTPVEVVEQEPAPPVQHTEEPVVPQTEDALPDAGDASDEYEEYLAAGKAKYASADYVSALDDFRKASEIKLTEEIVRLKIQADEQIERQNIEKRKAQYEVKRTFGVYQIVRKISNSLYGAIDDKGDEVIPCKYINIGITDEGNRAFEREDSLYDIYNDKGQLVNKGVPYY